VNVFVYILAITATTQSSQPINEVL